MTDMNGNLSRSASINLGFSEKWTSWIGVYRSRVCQCQLMLFLVILLSWNEISNRVTQSSHIFLLVVLNTLEGILILFQNFQNLVLVLKLLKLVQQFLISCLLIIVLSIVKQTRRRLDMRGIYRKSCKVFDQLVNFHKSMVQFSRTEIRKKKKTRDSEYFVGTFVK